MHALNLSHTDVSNRDLSSLESLVNLQSLLLVATDVSSLNQLGSPRRFRTLILGGTQVDDRVVSWLRDAENLRRLSLFSTGVTDSGVEELQRSLSLEYLNLSTTRITNKACTHVSQLPSLAHLTLDHTDITDRGIQSLESMQSLRRLSLADCKITDSGVQNLKRLKRLEFVDVTQTGITVSGLAELEDAFPGAQIWWNNEHIQSKRRQRDLLRKELFLNRFEDQYRKNLLKFQQRYYGVCIEAELPLR